MVFGRSLGGAVAAQLAKERQPVGLVLESTFTSVPHLGAEIYPWLPVRLLSRFQYNNLDKVSRITSPLLIVHSRDDEIIPYRMGQALFDAAPQPKAFVEIAGDRLETGRLLDLLDGGDDRCEVGQAECSV